MNSSNALVCVKCRTFFMFQLRFVHITQNSWQTCKILRSLCNCLISYRLKWSEKKHNFHSVNFMSKCISRNLTPESISIDVFNVHALLCFESLTVTSAIKWLFTSVLVIYVYNIFSRFFMFRTKLFWYICIVFPFVLRNMTSRTRQGARIQLERNLAQISEEVSITNVQHC